MKISKDLAISPSGFIFNPATGESFTANETGLDILKLLQENKSFDEIKNYILENYEISETDAEKDLTDFLNMLKQSNILTD